MRLTNHEREQILDAARRHFGVHCRVILFGSRVDDHAIGGDIDLFIETAETIDGSFARRNEFLMDLWSRIGERRVDVILKTPATAPEPVHDIAQALGVEL